jgi:hypothetical protein
MNTKMYRNKCNKLDDSFEEDGPLEILLMATKKILPIFASTEDEFGGSCCA